MVLLDLLNNLKAPFGAFFSYLCKKHILCVIIYMMEGSIFPEEIGPFRKKMLTTIQKHLIFTLKLIE